MKTNKIENFLGQYSEHELEAREALDQLDELIRLAKIGAAIEYHDTTNEIIYYNNENKLCILNDDELIPLIEWYEKIKEELDA